MYSNSLDFYVPDQFANKIIQEYNKDQDKFKESLDGDFIRALDMMAKLTSSRARLNEALKNLPQGQQSKLIDKINEIDNIIKFIDENRIHPKQFSDVELLYDGSIYSDINKLIGDEIIAAINYLIASQVVLGNNRDNISSEFYKHYEEEIGHLKILYSVLQTAGAKCDVDLKSLIENSMSGYFTVNGTDNNQLVSSMYESEIKAMNAYKAFYQKWNIENPALGYKILEIMNDELEHSNDLNKIGSELGLKLALSHIGSIGFFCDPKVPKDEVTRIIGMVKDSDNEMKVFHPEYKSDNIPLALRIPLALMIKDINTRMGADKAKVYIKKVESGVSPTSKLNDIIRLISDDMKRPINSEGIILKARNDYLARKPILDYEGPDKVHVNFEGDNDSNFAYAGIINSRTGQRSAGVATVPDPRSIAKKTADHLALKAELQKGPGKDYEKPTKSIVKSPSYSTPKIKSVNSSEETNSTGPDPVMFGVVRPQPRWNPTPDVLRGNARYIAKKIHKSSKSEKQAIQRLNQLQSTEGCNKFEVEKAKRLVKKLYADEVNMSDQDLIGRKDIDFAQWSGNVQSKWTPPEGLFTKDARSIARALYKASDSEKQAMSRLNFFINRAGAKAKNKAELEKAKTILKGMYAKDKEHEMLKAADVNHSELDHDKAKFIIYRDLNTNYFKVCRAQDKHLYLDCEYHGFETAKEAIDSAKKLNEKRLDKMHHIGSWVLTGGLSGLYGGTVAAIADKSDSKAPGYMLGGAAVGTGIGAGIGAIAKSVARNKINKIHEENSRYADYSEYYKDHVSSAANSTNVDYQTTNFSQTKNTEVDQTSKFNWINKE